MKRWLPFLLALSALLLTGCHAENASGQPTTNTPGATIATAASRPTIEMEDCYTYTEHKNGTYSYTVTDCYGDTILADQELARPVEFEPLNKDVLIVHGQDGVGFGARWARFCNIRTGYVTDSTPFYLAAYKDRVAFVDYRTDRYHVFVTDIYSRDTVYAAYTLENLSKPEGEEPITDFEMNKDGVLSVVYPTKSGEKTIKIDLKAK